MKFNALLTLSLACAPALWSAPQPKPKARAAARSAVVSAPAPSPDDQGLCDWSAQPFSDLASHGVLWRQGPGLLAWRLDSAAAFGSLATAPNPAKQLVAMSLGVAVEGEPGLRFSAVPSTLASWPLWAQEQSQDNGLQADVVTLYSAPDVVVAAVNLRNNGSSPLRLRPVLSLRRSGQALKATAELSAKFPALWLGLDRSAALGRPFKEAVGVWMGAQAWRASSNGQDLGPRVSSPLSGDLDLSLTWTLPQLLRPGGSLRIPVLLAWGRDMDTVQKNAQAQWPASALPQGLAWGRAKWRWAGLKKSLPAVEPKRQRLLRRAALALLEDRYGARAALDADALSASKGDDDSFDCVDTPWAALGLAELDLPAAEAALLDQASFSAAAPAPVPPYTGEEKLQWEAAGLPLNAWAAWELYHRDPDSARAAAFLGRLGERLRNECAWWAPNRDGDGNGLYAFARDDEKPAYLRLATPVLDFPVAASPAAGSGVLAAAAPLSPAALTLESWSLALTSLVAWQYQAASALADSAGDATGAQRWLGLSQHSQDALRQSGWDADRGAYRQDLDGLWPLVLGLETDPLRAQSELQQLLPRLTQVPAPWLVAGQWEPWRVYLVARALAAYGYFKEAHGVLAQFLDGMDAMAAFPRSVGGRPSAAASAASAAVTLEALLDRQEQEVFLTPQTGEFSAGMLQFRSLDGTFYMKRTKIPLKNDIYSKIKVETLNHGAILTENAFVFSAPESMGIQIQSERGMDISNLAHPSRLIFKAAHKVELLVPAKARMLVRFDQEAKQN